MNFLDDRWTDPCDEIKLDGGGKRFCEEKYWSLIDGSGLWVELLFEGERKPELKMFLWSQHY